jgi:hypothetical protein
MQSTTASHLSAGKHSESGDELVRAEKVGEGEFSLSAALSLRASKFESTRAAGDAQVSPWPWVPPREQRKVTNTREPSDQNRAATTREHAVRRAVVSQEIDFSSWYS